LKLLKKMNKTHWVSDIAFSFIAFIIVYVYVYYQYDFEKLINEFIQISNTLLGVWATILGFLLTAISILFTVKESKYIIALKKTGHFVNLLRVYISACYMAAIVLCVTTLLIVVSSNNFYMWMTLLFFEVLSIKRVFSCFYVLKSIIEISI